MTEVSPAFTPAAQRADRVSKDANARVRRRYRAESRFRAYGLAALSLTTAFVAVLVADIVWKGIPAFTEHTVKLEVVADPALIDPAGKREPQSLLAGDYQGAVRATLAAELPGAEGRAARKQLNDLLSSGAGDALRDAVVADPSLIGKKVATSVLLSDNADLYLKGYETAVSVRAASVAATPSGTSAEVTISAPGGGFASLLAAVKAELSARAAALKREASILEIKAADPSAARIADLRAEAAALDARATATEAPELLDAKLESHLVRINGGVVKLTKIGPSEAKGEIYLPLASAVEAKAGTWHLAVYETPESNRSISDRAVTYLEKLRSDGKIESGFNWRFFTSGDSREPELAGIRGALVGSLLTLFVTLVLCLPIGVLAAIYLEEFARKNWVTDAIEININNLAAVPSIVFGLLGLAVFLNFFGLPRSAPLVGGLVLALLVLPTIIIASRAALKAVPPSIKEAALGVGASHQQAVFHHVLPLAMPGIMTGSIIGMAHALGETAPLLMIGMIAFVVDVPQALTEAATVLPVQIYLWSDLPEPAFQAKTAGAILVLLAFLFLMNGTAIWLRKKFERRW